LRQELLRTEKKQKDAAIKQYRAFIAAHSAYDVVRDRVEKARADLSSVADALPELKKSCRDFANRAESVARARAVNQQLLNRVPGDISDILEIPQTQEQCGRNGAYDEALDLELYAERLRASLPDVPVIDDLRESARVTNKKMLKKLLVRLQEPIQLPECLRIVGHVRRSRYFESETALRRAFLARREVFVRNACEEVRRWLAPYDRAKKLTDVHRVHVFDVVTQYRAIFSDGDSSNATEGASSAAAATTTTTTTSNSNSDVTADESAILLSAWSSQRAESYKNALDESLQRVDEGGALASVFEHCEYCGNSLARVGVETRPLLREVFEKHALRIFEDALVAASEAFEKSLSTHRWTTYLAGGETTTENDEGNNNKDANSEYSPPQSLLEHAPVAAFVNGIVAAFNEVRLLTPKLRRCKKPFAKSLRKTFESGQKSLKNREKNELTSSTEKKKEAFKDAVRAYEKVAAPYASKCFARLFFGGFESAKTAEDVGLVVLL
jgi:hypothetical protein